MRTLNSIPFKQALTATVLLAGLTSGTAKAHLTPISFGTFDGSPASATALGSAIGNFGWIDGSDADWSDSHKVALFSFTLTRAADVLLSFEGKAAAGGRTGLNPGFSVYQGYPHAITDDLTADHDYSEGSILIRNTDSGGAYTEGSFRALTSWRITNDADSLAQDATNFNYIGHAYDGSQNYGTGIIPGGDGLLDNKVARQFQLAAGTYSVFVGGSNYASQTNFATRGIGAAITVVPLPAPFLLFLSGLSVLRLFNIKRNT